MHFVGFWFLTAAILLAAWFGIPILFRGIASRKLAVQARLRKAIVLTYDDGPSDGLTPRLVDLLKQRNVRATFFVIGDEAQQRPATIRRILQDGHEIGNHTFSHLNAWKTRPIRSIQDIQKGKRHLKELGVKTLTFRPPFGKSTPLTLAYCMMGRTQLAFWTHDSRDSWDRLFPEKILANLGATGGGVVLMHDFDRPHRGPSPHAHQEYILKLTEKIIDYAEANDFSIISYSELSGRLGSEVIESMI